VEDRTTINQLNEEINRVSNTTEFNTKKLLNGTVDRRSYSDNEKIQLISLSDSVSITEYALSVTKAPQPAQVETQIPGATSKTAALGYNGKIAINEKEIQIEETDTLTDIYEKLRVAGDTVDIEVTPTVEVPTVSRKLQPLRMQRDSCLKPRIRVMMLPSRFIVPMKIWQKLWAFPQV
jgi:flagellin